ncbi:MAG: TonB-dependent receptor [Pseudomonadota bacterium]
MFLQQSSNRKVVALRRALLGAALSMPLVILAGEVEAQQITSEIRGQVVTNSGQPVGNAPVVITHLPTGTTSTVTTNAQGGFSASGLRPGGPYTVSIASTASFQGTTIENVFLRVNQTLPLTLQVASGQAAVEEIVVFGQAAASAAYGGGSSAYGADTIEALPSISRDFKDVIRQNPFVDIDNANQDAISITGFNNRFNSLTVDGIRQDDDFGLNASGVPTQRTPISIDAIEQIGVNPAPFDVEFGRFQGGNINVVSKSGTNEFHGTAFYFFSRDDMVGNQSKKDKINLGDFSEKFYGGTLGGPIIKDKLFFFANYERFSGATPNTFGPAGSDVTNVVSEISVNDINRINQIAQTVYGFDTLGLGGASIKEKDEKIFAKIDWNINDDHRAFVSYQRTDGNRVVPQNNSLSQGTLGLLSNWYNVNEKLRAINFQLFSDWTDNFSTELKVGRKIVNNRQVSFGNPDFSEMEITTAGGGIVVIGPDEFRHANVLDNKLWQIKLKGDYLAGDHLISGGYELDSLDVFNLFVQTSQGYYQFNSIDDFENRRASFFRYNNAVSNNAQDGAANFRINVHTFYLQDQWTPTSELTLSGGMRLDLYQQNRGPAFNQNFLDRNGFDNAATLDSKKLIQPRLGFNYEFDARTTVRGGAGLFGGGDPNVWISNSFTVDGVTLADFSLTRSGNPALVSAILDNVSGFDIPLAAQNQLIAGNGSVAATDPNFKIPSAWKLNLGLDHNFDLGVLGDDWLVTIEAIWSRANNEADWKELRRTQIGTAPDGSPIYDKPGGFDLLLTNTSKGKSDTYAVSVQKAWDFGLTTSASYTYQDAEVVNPGTSSRAQSNYNFAEQTDRNNRTLGTSPFQIRHNVKLTATYKKAFIDDNFTTISLFYSGRSGRPYSLTLDNSSRELPFGGTSDTDGGDSHLFYVPLQNDPNVILSGITQADLDDFINRFGLEQYRGQNVPKGSFRSPWVNRLDMRLAQEIPFMFGKFELFFDMENLLNFIDSDWGRVEEANFPQITVVNVSINNANKFVYSRLRDPRLTLRNAESVWKAQLGIKYKF